MDDLENRMVVNGGSNGPDWLADDDDGEADTCEAVTLTGAERRYADLKRAVCDFLYAVDRGDYGDALKIGAGESTFVLALRAAVRKPGAVVRSAEEMDEEMKQ